MRRGRRREATPGTWIELLKAVIDACQMRASSGGQPRSTGVDGSVETASSAGNDGAWCDHHRCLGGHLQAYKAVIVKAASAASIA